MLHALAARHQVDTLTAKPWSAAETNAFYGTTIDDRGIGTHLVPAPWAWLSNLDDDRLTRLRFSSVFRYARQRATQYDLVISADGFAPYGVPGIQYVHFPALLKPRPARLAALVVPYFAFCERVLAGDWADAVGNVTLVNSHWTGRQLHALGEVTASTVLYPPVIDPGHLAWESRDDVFLCIGRFHPTKRIETAISIVARARAQSHPNARLAIVGSAVDRQYTQRIKALAAGHAWIEFHEDLSRDVLNALLRRSRYGIQAMVGEHFGMATAEMTRAGCLVFAHDSGGTPEVLDHEPALVWSSEDEAVARIRALEPRRIGARLRERAQRFSTEAFVESFLQIVDRATSGSGIPGPA
jgi:glycosyltransferase involved in cell wall biosynthesis